MFIALNDKNERIEAKNGNKGIKYYCPLCHKDVIFKQGKVRKPYFAHKIRDDFEDWGDMSEWHLDWQEKFPIECREVPVPKDKPIHRADVLLENLKTVIEFQHSPISKDDFDARNSFYTSCGYSLVWIFDFGAKIRDACRYTLNPIIHSVYDLDKLNHQTLEWKRKQSTFATNIDYTKVQIYLECRVENISEIILLPVKSINEYDIEVYYLTSYISKDVFLKTFGGVCDNINVKIIPEITQETIQYIKSLRVQRQYTTNYYIPVRRGRFYL